MAFVERHPEYLQYEEDWTQCRDTYKGERRVKQRGFHYLPATQSMELDGLKNPTDLGYKAYNAYRKRARFPGFMREAVTTAVGMLHSKPAKFNLPAGMENIQSADGESLQQLLRMINTEQLLTGRVVLLPDINRETDEVYIALYSAERFVNWDVGETSGQKRNLRFAILNEGGYERTDSISQFSWQDVVKYRVAIKEDGEYRTAVYDDNSIYDPSELITPSYRGRILTEIPLVIINSCDLAAMPDDPPLMDLSNLCLTIYRGEADYRQNLFMQGQDTLVVMGVTNDEDEPVRTGAGARIETPLGGDAKYIGVESEGLAEQRESLENDRRRAGSMGAQTLDSTSRERESGQSLYIRIAARTADLNLVAEVGAVGLENALKYCAQWLGFNPDEISIEPNFEFGDERLTGQTMVEQQTARNLGFPISAQSLHEYAVDKGLTKRTFEEEVAAARAEASGPFAPMKEMPGGNRDQV